MSEKPVAPTSPKGAPEGKKPTTTTTTTTTTSSAVPSVPAHVPGVSPVGTSSNNNNISNNINNNNNISAASSPKLPKDGAATSTLSSSVHPESTTTTSNNNNTTSVAPPPNITTTTSSSSHNNNNTTVTTTTTTSASPNNNNNNNTISAHQFPPNAVVSRKLGIVTVPGSSADLWDCEEHRNAEAPVYPHGAGFSYDDYCAIINNNNNNNITFIPASPYLKEPPPAGLQLESFDLRVIYEAGRTGFEESKEFPIVVNSVIAGRYQVLQYLDSAAFSRAVRCLDLKHNLEVCIKIIRNSKDFFDQSLDEIKLLQFINCNGDPDENCVLQLFDYFYFKEHIFIVCELLRDNLYEFSKFNREQESEFYFTMARVQSIARQVLKALSFVHSQHLLHCDLKPENILIKSYSRCEIKVIDFGSSCFETDNLSSYVQSRCYRAPEVILGCHYDGRIDVWSLGAILPELLTGRVLFHNDTVPGMLARIAGVCGAFPERLLHEGRHTCRYVTAHGVFFERTPQQQLLYHFPVPDPLRRMDFGEHADELFVDFVCQCLTVDYRVRPTAAQLLEHPFMRANYGAVYSAPPPLKKA